MTDSRKTQTPYSAGKGQKRLPAEKKKRGQKIKTQVEKKTRKNGCAS